MRNTQNVTVLDIIPLQTINIGQIKSSEILDFAWRVVKADYDKYRYSCNNYRCPSYKKDFKPDAENQLVRKQRYTRRFVYEATNYALKNGNLKLSGVTDISINTAQELVFESIEERYANRRFSCPRILALYRIDYRDSYGYLLIDAENIKLLDMLLPSDDLGFAEFRSRLLL